MTGSATVRAAWIKQSRSSAFRVSASMGQPSSWNASRTARRAWVSRCRTQRASTSADAGTGRVSRRRNGDGRASGHLPDRAAQGAGSPDTATGCAMGWPALRTSTQSRRSPGRGFGVGSRDWRPWFISAPYGQSDSLQSPDEAKRSRSGRYRQSGRPRSRPCRRRCQRCPRNRIGRFPSALGDHSAS